MNDREQFEAWSTDNWMYIDVKENASVIWKACAESKQSELYKANARIVQIEEEVEHYISAYKLAHDQAMENGASRDKANSRIAQLCETLLKVHNHPDAERLQLGIFCTLCKSPDTWLSEHDKTVEVRVLEEVISNTYESETLLDAILGMIESRK